MRVLREERIERIAGDFWNSESANRFGYYITQEESNNLRSGVPEMEVSILLKKLDSLNEEGRAIQKEKKEVDDELANTRLQCELIAQAILSLKKRIAETALEDEGEVISLEIEAEKKKEVIQYLQQRVQELKQQKKQMVQSIEEEAEAIHNETVEGKNQLTQSQLLTKERIEKEEVSQQQQLDRLNQQISCLQIEDTTLNDTIKRERAELQNLVTLIQSVRRSIQELDEEMDGMSLSIADQERENAELKRSFHLSFSVC